MTNEEHEKILHREPITEHQKEIIKKCLNRLFTHTIWGEPAGEIDSLLASSKKQDALFARKGLTEKFIIHGQS